MENILRIYAYNKWPYKKERLWHFEENETFSHLEQTEGLRFYRVKFGDVQKAVSSQDFFPIDLTYNFWDKFASFKELEFRCKANKDSTIYDISERYTLKCSDLKFLPALEKNFKWITGKNLENKVAFNRGDDKVCEEVFYNNINARYDIRKRIYLSKIDFDLYYYINGNSYYMANNAEHFIRNVESQLEAQYGVRAVLQDNETLCAVQTKFKNERNIDFAAELFNRENMLIKTIKIENITRPLFFVVKSDGELKTNNESGYDAIHNVYWHNLKLYNLNVGDEWGNYSNLERRLFGLKQLEYSCHKHTDKEMSCENIYALNQAIQEALQYFSSDEAKWESYDLNENKEQTNE